MPAASVIVPAFNAGSTLDATLTALAGQDLAEPFEVIVVDNGSEDDTAEIAGRHGVRVIRQGPKRPGDARNRGVAESRADAIAFTDADCAPAPEWLRIGCSALRDADLVQGAVCPDSTARRHPLERTLSVGREEGLYQTASLFVRRDPFEAVGGFRDLVEAAIEAPFGEDTDLAWRLRRAGARTRFCPQALVEHAVFPRGLGAYLRERLRYYHFPALVAAIPELRRAFLHRRLFLSRRSARFDLAVATLAATPLVHPLLLLGALPYAWLALGEAMRWRRRAPLALLAGVCGDAIGLVALVAGSVRRRTPVL